MKIGDYGWSHEFDSETKEEKRRPWSDLPFDLLSSIMGQCYLVDQIHFRAVCKSWRAVNDVPSIDNIPWLMTYNWDKAHGNVMSTCKFFDPLRKQIYTIENATIEEEERKDFKDATVVASKNGWLLLQNPKRPFPFFFYNPFKMEIIKLPSLDVEYSCKATFSTTPTSPDSVIFVVESSENIHEIIISTCHCGDTEWHQTYIVHGFFNYVKDVVYSKGTLYCIFNDGMLGAFCVANNDWSILITEPQLMLKSPSQYEFHMVESDGYFVLVCIGKNVPLRIFKFDWSTMAWVKEDNLGNRAVFIDRTSCVVSAAGETRNLRNKIYYHGYMYTWFYALETGKSWLCTEFYPWVLKGGPKKVWINCPRSVVMQHT